jgi:hypothetical protein
LVVLFKQTHKILLRTKRTTQVIQCSLTIDFFRFQKKEEGLGQSNKEIVHSMAEKTKKTFFSRREKELLSFAY